MCTTTTVAILDGNRAGITIVVKNTGLHLFHKLVKHASKAAPL